MSQLQIHYVISQADDNFITGGTVSTDTLTLSDKKGNNVVISGFTVSGDTGFGVPPSGTTSQYLIKASDDDFDTEWSDFTDPYFDPTGNNSLLTKHHDNTNNWSGITNSAILFGADNKFNVQNNSDDILTYDSVILGGSSNKFHAQDNGAYVEMGSSLILGGFNNQFYIQDNYPLIATSNIYFEYLIILGGNGNKFNVQFNSDDVEIRGSSILGGSGNKFDIQNNTGDTYIDYSLILGGSGNKFDIQNNTGDTYIHSSLILGGSNNTISSSINNSVILGGENITGTSNNTVYVPNINIGGGVIINTKIITDLDDGYTTLPTDYLFLIGADTNSNFSINLLSKPEDGQTYAFISQYNDIVTINGLITYKGVIDTSFIIQTNSSITITYIKSIGRWLVYDKSIND